MLKCIPSLSLLSGTVCLDLPVHMETMKSKQTLCPRICPVRPENHEREEKGMWLTIQLDHVPSSVEQTHSYHSPRPLPLTILCFNCPFFTVLPPEGRGSSFGTRGCGWAVGLLMFSLFAVFVSIPCPPPSVPGAGARCRCWAFPIAVLPSYSDRACAPTPSFLLPHHLPPELAVRGEATHATRFYSKQRVHTFSQSTCIYKRS